MWKRYRNVRRFFSQQNFESKADLLVCFQGSYSWEWDGVSTLMKKNGFKLRFSQLCWSFWIDSRCYLRNNFWRYVKFLKRWVAILTNILQLGQSKAVG